MKRIFQLFTAVVMAMWVMTGVVLAQAPPPGPGEAAPQPDGPIVTGVNVWLTLIGLATPLVGYLLNHYARWASAQVKGLIQAAVAAGGALVYQLLSDGNFGFNVQTLVAVLTTMAAAVIAHLGYRAGGINVALGGGTNHDGRPEVDRRVV